jgi:hypothetical protein
VACSITWFFSVLPVFFSSIGLPWREVVCDLTRFVLIQTSVGYVFGPSVDRTIQVGFCFRKKALSPDLAGLYIHESVISWDEAGMVFSNIGLDLTGLGLSSNKSG